MTIMTEKQKSMVSCVVASVMSFTERLTTLSLPPSWMLNTQLTSKTFETKRCSSSFSSSLSFSPFPLVAAPCTTRRDRRNNSYLSTVLILIIATIVGVTQFNSCSAQKLFGKSQPTSIVIPHIKYGQGLNRWSFLSVDRDNHGLHSDLLCPNPIFTSPGGISGRAGSGGGRANTGLGGGRNRQQQQHQLQQQPSSKLPVPAQSLPNEIWAVKTHDDVSQLPCSLRQYAVPLPPFNSNNGNGLVMMNAVAGGGAGIRHNNGHFIENQLLFINVSLVPFNFRGATPCTKYIKLMYDEEEGTNFRCWNNPFEDTFNNKYHIFWPDSVPKRKEHFSLLEILERFLQNEQTYRRQFYFQVYFTSFNGRSKRCSVQQYELDLSYPAGNARFCNLTQIPGGHEELCGEFPCDDLIFPLFDPKPHDGKHRGRLETEEEYDDEYDDDKEDYGDEEGSREHDTDFKTHHKHHPKLQTKAIGDGTGSSLSSSQTHNDDGSNSWARMLRLDMRLLIFITIVPLVLFGVLVFGLELIVYFMCCRK
ncbi:unnamed protein product [Orchesella dallaii]